jgi:hypothetical protein
LLGKKREARLRARRPAALYGEIETVKFNASKRSARLLQATRLSSASTTALGRQRPLHCFPYKFSGNVFVVMAIDVSRASYLLPGDSWMPRFHIIPQAA